MILQPPSALLTGPSGAGKTSALATQLLYGLRVFVVVTEPDGVASLLDAAERLKAPIDMLHWAFAPAHGAGWMELEDMYSKVNTLDQKGLADMRDLGKSSFRDAGRKFLMAFKNFHCDRTGQDFGDFTTWGDNCSMNVDSLTGWSQIAWGLTVGYKPTANPGEWGIGQNVIFSHLMKINADRQCFFNLTAHIEKETDEMTGTRRITVSTIGAKLAPKIPPFFGEVIRCARDLDIKTNTAQFTWSTVASDQDLKNRALPIGVKMKADFGPIIDAYRRRVKLAGGSVAPPQPATSAGTTASQTSPAATVVPPAAPMSPKPPQPKWT